MKPTPSDRTATPAVELEATVVQFAGVAIAAAPLLPLRATMLEFVTEWTPEAADPEVADQGDSDAEPSLR